MTSLEDTSLRALRDLRHNLQAVNEHRTRDIVDDVRARLFGTSEVVRERQTLGRYELIEPISYGGMGLVQRAEDPFLKRKVAIKLCLPERENSPRAPALNSPRAPALNSPRAPALHTGGSQGGNSPRTSAPNKGENTKRLLNEARALGALRHPNIVQVLDAGIINEQLYVVLELVEGPTLAQWLLTPRSWRAVYEVFLAVGEALRATHAQKLLHRDVKPSNILLTRDNQVKLIDFGLVTSVDSDPGEAEGPLTPLDEKGRLLGTRGFLAPELYLGQAPSVQSDLFSYCVAFYWALYRLNPFPNLLSRPSGQPTSGAGAGPAGAGVSVTPLSSSPEMLLGPYREPGSGAPRWLARVLRRGLDPDPAKRYPSMDALLSDLRRSSRVRPLVAQAAVGLVLASSYAFASVQTAANTHDVCSDAPLARLWEDSQEQVREALSASTMPLIRAASGPIMGELGRYASAWDKAHAQVCYAEHNLSQSSAVSHAQIACLERARHVFEARAAGQLSGVVDPAELGLLDLSACTNKVIARQICHAPIVDGMYAEEAREIESMLSGAQEAVLRGDFGEANTLADAAVKALDAVPAAGLHARVHLARGEILYLAGEYKRAVPDLLLARSSSIRSECHDVLADSLSHLNKISARFGLFSREETESRLREQVVVAGWLEDATRLADAHNDMGLWSRRLGSELDYVRARRELEKAIEIREAIPALDLSGTLALAESYLNLASALHQLPGDEDEQEAQIKLKRSMELRAAAVGAEHPSNYKHFLNLGHWATDAQKFDEAEENLTRAQGLARGYGERSTEVAKATLAFARLAMKRGDNAKAIELARAASVSARELSGGDPDFDTDMGIAQILYMEGDGEQGRSLLEESLRLLAASLEKYDSPTTERPERAAEVHARLALVFDELSQPADTELHARAALERFKQGEILFDPYLALAQHRLGRALSGLVEGQEPGGVSDDRLQAALQAFHGAIATWKRQPEHALAESSLADLYVDRADINCRFLHKCNDCRLDLEMAKQYDTDKVYEEPIAELKQLCAP